eukprot:TRINITY_DN22385_c0_g1_i1.p1 TRINITY_DN22385_c0_g1~~TRINITY_DN22385_c0_g1_i1.p1  ORF type:complete len:228 (+),score=39.16 TRINITY_DN22385_c0_g1_i1:32-685(+)
MAAAWRDWSWDGQKGWHHAGLYSAASGRRPKESAAHRRARQQRSFARQATRLASTIAEIASHHGSHLPKPLHMAIQLHAGGATSVGPQPQLRESEVLRNEMKQLLEPTSKLVRNLDAKVQAINQGLVALHSLVDSLVQAIQVRPDPSKLAGAVASPPEGNSGSAAASSQGHLESPDVVSIAASALPRCAADLFGGALQMGGTFAPVLTAEQHSTGTG